MTPEAQTLVRDTFAAVGPIAHQAAAIFYARLFALDPSLKPLFKGDMNEQGRKLMAMIGTGVANLDKLETILPAVQELGRRHAGLCGAAIKLRHRRCGFAVDAGAGAGRRIHA